MREERHSIPEWISRRRRHRRHGRSGSVVTLLADSGDRYTDTYFCDEWLAAQGMDSAEPAETLASFEASCRWA